MDLVNLRIVSILVTMICIGIYIFLMIFNYRHRSNTEIKKEKRLNRLNQILKQEQEGIYMFGWETCDDRQKTLCIQQFKIFYMRERVYYVLNVLID